MRNSILISLLIFSIISCRRPQFRQDKIQFSDSQSISEKKVMSSLVSEIFSQDAFRLHYSERGCAENAYFRGIIVCTRFRDSLKLTYTEIEAPDSSGRHFFYAPSKGLAIYLSDEQQDSIKQIFAKYANRQYKMHSTSNQTIELEGLDTSFTVENYYTYQGNPLSQLDRLLEVKKIKGIAQKRGADTSALDIYWSEF